MLKEDQKDSNQFGGGGGHLNTPFGGGPQVHDFSPQGGRIAARFGGELLDGHLGDGGGGGGGAVGLFSSNLTNTYAQKPHSVSGSLMEPVGGVNSAQLFGDKGKPHSIEKSESASDSFQLLSNHFANNCSWFSTHVSFFPAPVGLHRGPWGSFRKLGGACDTMIPLK